MQDLGATGLKYVQGTLTVGDHVVAVSMHVFETHYFFIISEDKKMGIMVR